MAFFQWFVVMLSMSTALRILLHSKCYCNIWHVFCWHLLSLLFYVNKVLWEPGILLPPLLYPFEKDSNLLQVQDFLLVFKPASCQPVGGSNRWNRMICWPYNAFILIRMKLAWNELILVEDRTRTVKWGVYELDSSLQVFLPLCHALVVVRLNVLFFFSSFNQSFTGFTFAGGELPHLLSDSRIETSSQTKRKQVCGPSKVDKKKSSAWFRIRLRDSEVTLWYFFKQW